MRVAEIYKSVQGEGLLTGTETVFVRASGCNLRCSYCDTPYASWQPEGDDLSIAQILTEIERLDCGHVVLTGGEPMLFAETIPLCAGLAEKRIHITIETAGTLYLPLACDLMSISPKLSNSTPDSSKHPQWHHRHEQSRHVPSVIFQLLREYEYQLKFVVGSREDPFEVERYLEEFASEVDRSKVMLMPEGIDPQRLNEVGKWLQPLCAERGWRFCPRKHIEWFGLERFT